MSFLTLNGIPLPVALDGLSRLEPELVGEMGRAFSGAELANVRAWKDGWRAKLTPQAAATAAAIRALAEGEGYSWSFDTDLYPDLKGGPGPSSSTGCSVVSTGKYGSKLRITAGNRLQYSVAGSSTKWTLIFWKLALDQAGVLWEHYVVRGDGSRWRNGALDLVTDTWADYDGATLTFHSPADFYPARQPSTAYVAGDYFHAGTQKDIYVCMVSGNTGAGGDSAFTAAPNLFDFVSDAGTSWSNVGNGWGHFDDALFLPCLVPSSWPAQLYAEASARAWTPLPRLRLAGDAAAGLAAGYATVTGKVLEAPLRRRALAGAAAVTNAEELELELREA